MSSKSSYNTIAENYMTAADQFGAISQSHEVAMTQIAQVQLKSSSCYNILDLGVGDAAFLVKLKKEFSLAKCTGIDLSPGMLKRAKKALDLITIEASALEASQHLPPKSQDLVLAHFINAYVPIDPLFQEANVVTREGGYFSMITTTYESSPLAQRQLEAFFAKNSLISRLAQLYYKVIIKHTPVASSAEELLRTFIKYDFQVVAHQRLHIPVKFETVEELIAFGVEGGWFVNIFSIRILPKKFVLWQLKRFLSKILTFPYEDIHIIDILLAQKEKGLTTSLKEK
jgi:ubiquinone/menaquinone biosynthesis C-methylase UbiE